MKADILFPFTCSCACCVSGAVLKSSLMLKLYGYLSCLICVHVVCANQTTSYSYVSILSIKSNFIAQYVHIHNQTQYNV